MPGFYSERTAEYTLIPKFIEVLKPLGAVIPIFFTGGRENTNVSLQTLKADSFHLVAFFSRRPKIDSPGSLCVEGKINKSLFRVARCASGFGILTFCGMSLTNNIFGQPDAKSIWLDISSTDIEEDILFSVDIRNYADFPDLHRQVTSVSHSEIVSRVASSKILSWEEIVNIMTELPKQADNSIPGRFMFLSQVWRLRPVYFAIRRAPSSPLCSI